MKHPKAIFKPLLALAAATLLVSGCASMAPTELPVQVSSFGVWPKERKVSTFAFERLPSQQARAAEMDRLENAASPALAKAGFKLAPRDQADTLVQLNQRVSQTRQESWAPDRWWWQGVYVNTRRGVVWNPGFGFGYDHQPAVYQHEVAVLMRDRQQGTVLYETHAGFNGLWASASQWGPMFEAAMKDFGQAALNPRLVVMPLPVPLTAAPAPADAPRAPADKVVK